MIYIHDICESTVTFWVRAPPTGRARNCTWFIRAQQQSLLVTFRFGNVWKIRRLNENVSLWSWYQGSLLLRHRWRRSFINIKLLSSFPVRLKHSLMSRGVFIHFLQGLWKKKKCFLCWSLPELCMKAKLSRSSTLDIRDKRNICVGAAAFRRPCAQKMRWMVHLTQPSHEAHLYLQDFSVRGGGSVETWGLRSTWRPCVHGLAILGQSWSEKGWNQILKGVYWPEQHQGSPVWTVLSRVADRRNKDLIYSLHQERTSGGVLPGIRKTCFNEPGRVLSWTWRGR